MREVISVARPGRSSASRNSHLPCLSVIMLFGLVAAACYASPAGACWQRSAANPVIVPGVVHPDGRKDLAIGDPAVLFDSDDGLWKAWWATYLEDPAGANSAMAVKYAESSDGIAWNVQSAPVLESHRDAADWDYTNVETPFVVKVPMATAERRYFLYYSGANDLETPGRSFPFYQIGLAFSADGKSFTRLPAGESPYNLAGLVFRGEDAMPAVSGIAKGLLADPTLILKDGQFLIWSSSSAEDADQQPLAFGIIHASSADGIHWTPAAQNPLPSLRRPGEVHSGAQPSVLWNATLGLYEMWFTNDTPEALAAIPATFFTAAAFWHATSADGVDWSIDYAAPPDFSWTAAFEEERWGLMTGVHVVLQQDEYRMYYPAWSSREVPPGFLVPTQNGFLDGVAALSLATRPAATTTIPCGGASATCGDGTLQPGCVEQCDDGNNSDGDGCSSCCVSESSAQDRDQQDCMNALNKSFAKVAAAQGKDICTCIRDFAKGRSLTPADTLEACLTADRRGRVASAVRKAVSAETKRCGASAPDFGATDSASVVDAATSEELNLFHDIYGADLGAAIASATPPTSAVSKCQQGGAKAIKRCVDANLRAFNRCKKKGLKETTIGSSVTLATCMGLDPKSRIAKACDPANGKVRSAIDKSCAGTSLATAFPGLAASAGCTVTDAAGGAACFQQRGRCRVCLALEQADALVIDCDTFDDSVVNFSCIGP